jgi:hypothetical protein
VHAIPQQVGEGGIDQPLPFDAGTPGEGRGDDLDGEMGLALGPCTGMAGVAVRIVDDGEALRRERVGQDAADRVGDLHAGKVAMPGGSVKRGLGLTAIGAPVFIEAMKLPALHAAAQTGTYTAFARLVAEGADVNTRSESGETALMLAAARGRLEFMGLLIERGADANAATDAGNTALMFAAARGQVDAARLLLDRGARADHVNKYGLGAADWARWSERQSELLALFGTASAA